MLALWFKNSFGLIANFPLYDNFLWDYYYYLFVPLRWLKVHF